MSFILSFDIGTTSTRALLFNLNFNIVAIEQKDITQYYPKESWVEQCPEELFSLSLDAAQQLLNRTKVSAKQIACIGVTNQRETTVLWDKKTGKPAYNAIVWQDKRTSDYCAELKQKGLSKSIHTKTGLQIDPYFSATKVSWLLDNVKGLRRKAVQGDIFFGTVDTWFLWKISGGRVHATDVSNASRTMLYNINNLCWDDELLKNFNIPASILPEVKDSAAFYANTDAAFFDGVSIPVTGIAGDQQAALFGQMCFEKGMTKNTYGTGCFILMNVGNTPVKSNNGLITTIAWKIGGKITYALEGSVFIAGSLIKWLRDELGLIKDASETEQYALKASEDSQVYFVPCFSGLGAPYWDMNARGILLGLSTSTKKEHIIKAALESLAYQTKDVIEAMQKDAKTNIKRLFVDGGAAVNNYLMQFQSDMINAEVVRPQITESTALGAARLAAVGAGLSTMDDMFTTEGSKDIFYPKMKTEKRNTLYLCWLQAVEKARTGGES